MQIVEKQESSEMLLEERWVTQPCSHCCYGHMPMVIAQVGSVITWSKLGSALFAWDWAPSWTGGSLFSWSIWSKKSSCIAGACSLPGTIWFDQCCDKTTWLAWGSCADICVVVIWQLVGSENVWLKFVTGKLIWLWCTMPTTVKWFPPVVCAVDEHDWKDGALCSAWEVMFAPGKITFCIAWYGSGCCGNLVWTFCCLLGLGADLGWLKELTTDVATFLWGPSERSFTESITATPELLTLFNTFCW